MASEAALVDRIGVGSGECKRKRQEKE
jgi:hypothetical protein